MLGQGGERPREGAVGRHGSGSRVYSAPEWGTAGSVAEGAHSSDTYSSFVICNGVRIDTVEVYQNIFSL